jgi:threonine dehydratase
MISLTDVQQAADILRDRVIRTPLIYSATFSELAGAQVFLKLENLQKTGSFKVRGASYKLQRRQAEIGTAGVVAASAGNHAQGVALAARQAGLPATIIMPVWASITKQEATKGYGGEVLLEGQSLEESIEKARELAASGKVFVHPYDDPDIIIGQATVGMEIYEDLPDPDFVLVPVGGGGLISGIATVSKIIRPETKIIGVQAAACPSAHQAFRTGAGTRVEARKSIADGISVKQPGNINLQIIREKVDDIVLVEESQIAAAILMLLERKKVLAEGAGAVPVAALVNSQVLIPGGSKVVLVISGGNVDSPLLGRILRQGLFRNGRIMRLSVFLEDRPGVLAGFLNHVAGLQANVLHIYHDRSLRDLPIDVSRVELELETRSPAHVAEIVSALDKAGYPIKLTQ